MGQSLKLTPYDYQKEAIYHCIYNNNNNYSTLLMTPCGSGKSIMMIGAYQEAINNKIIDTQGLIIVKASLKKQMEQEIYKFSNFKATILRTYSDICSKYVSQLRKLEKELDKIPITNTTERQEIIKQIEDKEKESNELFNSQFNNVDLFVCNYETLLDDKVLNKLIELKLDYIASDEIQYAKTHTAARSKALYKLNKAKIKIGASATPITKDPRDIYGIFKFLNPDLLGKVGEFQKRYINFAGYGRINGFKNMDELKEKISPHVFIKTKEEVASQLPKLAINQIRFDLDNKQIDKFNEIMAEIDDLNKQDFKLRNQCKSEKEAFMNTDLQKISAKIMALQTFAQEISDSPLLLVNSESEMSKNYAEGLNLKINPKLDICLELVNEIIESGEKVCIFSKFERMQKILTDAILKEHKDIKIAYINGSLSSDRRYEEAYTKFKDNDNYKVLLCSDAGAEGLNLNACKYLIEYELASSYAIQIQRQGRIQRSDSISDNVFVYQLIANDSWDTIAEKIITKKENFDNDILKSIKQ